MIESIEFSNFKALRKTTLPLAPFTLLLGPNGSGKTTVLQALELVSQLAKLSPHPTVSLPHQPGVWSRLLSATAGDSKANIEITARIHLNKRLVCATFTWQANGAVNHELIA